MKNRSVYTSNGRHIGLYEGQSVKIFSRILTIFFFFFLIAIFSGKVVGANVNRAGTNTQLVVYPAPDGYTPSPNYTMTVNAKPVAVYDARIRNTWTGSDNNCAYTYFDFEGTVHVKVTVASGLQSVKIRPLSAGITATVKGNTILLKNIKLMGGDDYSNDGIDIISCQDFTVDNCFVYCFDDCVAIKAEKSKRRPVKDVSILNSLFWNIQAYGFVIGAELDAPSVSHVLVKNCDYIHSQQIEDPNDAYYFYSGTLGIFNGGDCDVHDIRFEDIRVEDAKAKLVSLKVMKSMSWNSVNVKFGKIHDIYFKNLTIADGIFIPSEIISENVYSKFIEGAENNYLEDNNIIQNITFENLRILGKQILNPYEGGFVVNPCTLNLRFIEKINQ